jgi:Protein of unknown function (DUF4058)
MPLRDHFRPPVDDRISWDAIHGQWPGMIVLSLARTLPRRYVAAPQIHLGAFAQIDVSAFEILPAQDEYEVRVYDTKRGRRLVAAIEIVSPANKDRPEHRRAFVAKCAALLQNQVSVTIVDVVTIRAGNLYGELLELVGQTDPSLGAEPPAIYAVACRGTKRGPKLSDPWQLETWLHPLHVGKPIPQAGEPYPDRQGCLSYGRRPTFQSACGSASPLFRRKPFRSRGRCRGTIASVPRRTSFARNPRDRSSASCRRRSPSNRLRRSRP